MFEHPPQTSLPLMTLGYRYVYLQNDLHDNFIIFKQFIGQTSDKLHGHNSYMQVIFSLIHKQDSISLPMNKQSLAGVYNAMTQKKIICIGDYFLPTTIITPSPNRTEPTYGP